MLNCHKKCQ